MKLKRILSVILVIALAFNISVIAFADESSEQPFNYYFVVGDSIPGFGADDLPGISGRFGWAKDTFPELIAEHFNIPNGYYGAHAGWRPQELRVVLEEDYYGDEYTSEWQPGFGGGSIAEFKAWGPEYCRELAKADLITVGLGGNTLMAYLLYIVDRALVQHTAGTELEQAAIAAIAEAREKNSESEALSTILEFIATLEDYTVLLNTTLREMPGEIVKFAESWDIMIRDIRELAPDAELVCTGIYCSAGNFIKLNAPQLGDFIADLGNALSMPFVNGINNHIKYFSSERSEYTYVDVLDVDLAGSRDGSHLGATGQRFFADKLIAAIENDICTHEHTQLVNVKAATKYSLGYSGDLVCTDCGKTVEKGCITFFHCQHENTTVVGAVQPTRLTLGYTGTHVCADCGKVIGAGHVVSFWNK